MRLSPPIRILGLLAAGALLASCAGMSSLQKQDAAEATAFNAYAGKPVDHFTWLLEHQGRAAIASNQLVAWADSAHPYLITVAQPCPNLMVANGIGITSTGDEVRAHSDLVAVRGMICGIESIQPVDYPRMQRDLRQKLAEEPESRFGG